MSNSVAESGTITIDLIKPVPAITGMALGKQKVGLNFAFDELLDSCQVLRSDNTTSFTVTGSGVSEQGWLDTGPLGNELQYYYKLVATDLAGNTNTSNMVCAILALEGGIIYNNGQFALPNSAVRCKDLADAYVVVLETQTFGNTIDLVKIEMAR